MATIRAHNVVEANSEKGTWGAVDTSNREVSRSPNMSS